MKKYFFILGMTIYSFVTFGQNAQKEAVPAIELTTIVQVNQGNSYITFPTDIGNIEPLFFEGNLNPNFYIRTNKNARLVGVLTPQIIIRMYQEESFPVRTPSYMPQITAYYLLNSKSEIDKLSLYGKIAHHSNGQEDDFFLPNGNINTRSGNFSTNFYEVGLIKTNYNEKYNAMQFFGTSIEIHPIKSVASELLGMYSRYRWHTIFSIFKIPKNEGIKKNASISLKGQTTWMFGDLNNWNIFDINRLNLRFTFYYHPKFLEDVGFFTQIYHGLDYYNIYFNHQISIIRFGIMTEKLRF